MASVSAYKRGQTRSRGICQPELWRGEQGRLTLDFWNNNERVVFVVVQGAPSHVLPLDSVLVQETEEKSRFFSPLLTKQ